MDMEKTVEKYWFDVQRQIESGKNTNSYGETQAWILLDNGRSVEITLETEGLLPAEQFFSAVLHCNSKEYDREVFAESNGVVFQFVSSDVTAESLHDVIRSVCEHNVVLPVKKEHKDFKEALCEEIGNYFGVFTENDGIYSIDNGEQLFVYSSCDELLEDWVDTLAEDYDNDWNKEIEFVLKHTDAHISNVFVSETTNGILRYSVLINAIDPRNKNNTRQLSAGTYDTVSEALKKRRVAWDLNRAYKNNEFDFDELRSRLKLLARKKTDFEKGYEEALNDIRNSLRSDDVNCICEKLEYEKFSLEALMAAAKENKLNNQNDVDETIPVGRSDINKER